MTRNTHPPTVIEPPTPAELEANREKAREAEQRRQQRAAEKAAQRARGIARRAPLADAHWRSIFGQASAEDERRLRRAKTSRVYRERKREERRTQAAAERVRQHDEKLREALRDDPVFSVDGEPRDE